MRRSAKTEGKILLTPQEHDNVGFSNFCGGAIQTALEKSEGVRMIVGNKTACLLFGQHRQASRFDEALQCITGKRVTGGAAGDHERLSSLAQERDRAANVFRMSQD